MKKKKTCNFCGKIINHHLHIKTCAKKYGINKSFNELKLDLIFYNSKIDEELFSKQYNSGHSISELADIYNLYYKDIKLLIDHYNLEYRNIKKCHTKQSINKYKNTCIEKYGVDNVSKSNIVKEKKKETFIKNYGVDNIFKTKEFIIWLNEHMLNKFGKRRLNNPDKISAAQKAFTQEQWNERLQKIQNTSIERFGYDNYSKHPERRKKISDDAKLRWENYTDEQKSEMIAKRLMNKNKWQSNLEKRIYNLLNELQIEFTTQKFFKNYSYDFYIDSIGLFIEVHGDFWHANPVIYKANDELSFPGGNIVAKDLWKKDKHKKMLVEKCGYKLISIWESEMKCDRNKLLYILIEKIKNELK